MKKHTIIVQTIAIVGERTEGTCVVVNGNTEGLQYRSIEVWQYGSVVEWQYSRIALWQDSRKER